MYSIKMDETREPNQIEQVVFKAQQVHNDKPSNADREQSLFSKSRSSQFHQMLPEFADEIGITGIKYIFGSSGGHCINRLLWSAILMACLITGFILFIPIWNSYQNGDTIIVIIKEKYPKMEYPSVTICNLNRWRRSVVGGAYKSYIKITGDRSDPLASDRPACDAPKLHELYPELEKEKVDVLYRDTTALSRTFEYFVYMIASPSVYQSVLRCKFKGKTLTSGQCYASFINTVIYDGLCFIFNPSNQSRYHAVNDDDVDDKSASGRDPTFPKQVASQVTYTAQSHGPGDSIDLLLNVQQYEYCALDDTDGVGFEIQVHAQNPALRPIIMRLNSDNIRLSPGKEMIASIREVKYIRQTEHFGRCLRKMNYKFYPYITDYYPDACINDCVTERIQSQCGCMPQFAPIGAQNQMLRNASEMGQNEERFICLTAEQAACVHSTVKLDIGQQCSKCMAACEEINYRIQVTYNDFPAENTFHLYKHMKYPKINYAVLRNITRDDHHFHTALNFSEYIDPWSMRSPPSDFKDINEIRQNLLLLRLQYYEMNVEVITEKLATQLQDIASQFGGLLGLFIGASIISFVELFYWIAMCCRYIILI